ncbi:MAG: lysophospholipid acyltransferase family protein [Rhodobacteraceae bacterium]|nr:lysophospholipid acyltransferase family protein [Paracoccaceae bacterium]
MRRPSYDTAVNAALRGLLGIARMMPYERRIPFVGAVTRGLVAPIAGYHRRSEANLRLVFPAMPPAERRRIARAAADNAGRALAEIFSGAEFIDRIREAPATGPGHAAIAEARAAGRPVILVSGHFGNYDVPRGWFAARGVEVGGLYKPLANQAFNEAYVAAIARVSTPVFERGRKGLGQMIGFLREGGVLGVLFDQRIPRAETLDFLGHPARTAFSAAELALKYDALMVPVYGIRQPDGLSFEFAAEPPIPHGDPRTMMQAATDSLAARVRARPEQYFWIHRRWKD